ncbi:hypothetical protein [Euzebya sp.]|uniref:hypothetical protein n=1 Tax=Euzebya sp. TaxID=1971409 RepID=UPI003516A28D
MSTDPRATPRRPIRPLPSTPAEDTDQGLRTQVTTRILIALTILLGQLWALTVALEEYLLGHTGRAWGLAGFSIVSFLVVLALVRLEPPPRGSGRPGRR